MHEVKVRVVRDSTPQRRLVLQRKPAPTDHGQSRALAHLDHATIQQAEALVPAMLRRFLEEELIAEAHPEHWLSSFGELDHPPADSTLRELFQRGGEGADPRQHQAVGALQLVPVGREFRLRSDVKEGAFDRAQVADPVIDDRNHPRRPLDDGTPPPLTLMASRSANPSALNVASAM